MRTIFSTLVAATCLLVIAPAHAQTTVGTGSFGFSNGVHPTFTFLFEGTDTRFVESYWRDELKKISHEVSNKKEVIAAGALVPSISPDTMRILVKADQRKGSPMLTAQVAILTTAGYVGPDSDPAVLDAAKAFVQLHSTAIRRQLAQKELTDAQRGLSLLQGELTELQRNKDRAEAGIVKSGQREAEAVQEQQKQSDELADLDKRIDAVRAELAGGATDALNKDLKGLQRDQERASDRRKKAVELEQAMQKKAKELADEVRKNEADQLRKQEEITRQETLVRAMQEKLDAIH